MNKYEREVMMNIWIVTALVVVMIVVNLICPVFKSTIGGKSVFQWLMVLIYIWGMLYQRAYLKGQKVPIVQIVIIRLLEVFVHSMFMKSMPVNWPFMLFAYALDIVYIALLMVDKAQYKYIEEEID